MINASDVCDQLAHVLWLGGPPDCGKTSIATELARAHDLQVYHFDRHEIEHFSRVDPIRHPSLYRAHPDRMTAEERWLGSLPESMARETIACWTERFSMVVEDLLHLPSAQAIVAEGPGFFPECLAPHLTSATQAIWLVPTPAFKTETAIRRGKPGSRFETSDPERAQRNLIERDLLMGAHVRRCANQLNLPVYEVDGTKNLTQVLGDIEAYFQSWLVRSRDDAGSR